ncbi:plant-specific TFIIB-related protein [Salix suchowensis]|nr:plant-specific TFIIB-related protein [Salix suchowensis]
MSCKACGLRTLIRDDATENMICDSCGTVQDFINYQERAFNINGPTGVFISIGSSGCGSVLNYKEKKIYEANNLIDDVVFKLGLTGGSKVREIRDMISKVTDGRFGSSESRWFSIFVGACVYVVMRNDDKSLSIEEVSSVVGCDIHELGRMVMRVIEHLGMKLPDFDIVGSFERVVRSLSILDRVEEDVLVRMRKQGIFLVQCAVKWFLTTGRRPLPVVVAVLVLVAELNGVEGVKIEEVAREVHVAVSTCRLRYKELLEMIVKVAQEILPWGKDVNVKNAVKNAPLVIRYLETKCMSKSGGERKGLESTKFDLGEVVGECFSKNVEYGVEEDSFEYGDLRYFELEDATGFDKAGIDEVDKLHFHMSACPWFMTSS